MGYVILLAVVAALVIGYRYRFRILAKVLGQPERRIERHYGSGRRELGRRDD